MKKILLLLILARLSVMSAGAQHKQQTFLLVHGAWHGAWCWYKITPLLEAKGNKVIAFDLPGHGKDSTDPDQVSFRTYVDKVKSVALSQPGEVVLVGHSMAGTIISQAGEELGTDKVKKLIYLDAFLPRNGESVRSLAGLISSTLPPDSTKISIGQGLIMSENKKTSVFKPETADILFYHDCSEEDKALAHKNLSRQSMAPNGTPVSVSDSIYGKIPKYYILCTESKDLDKSILPTRVPCEKVVKIKSGHSPFFSKPKQLAKILTRL